MLSLAFGIGIGVIMALLFHRGDTARLADAAVFAGGDGISRRTVVFLMALIALLLAGTLKVDFLTARLASFDLALPGAPPAQALLDRLVPVDTIKGEEGLSLQGVALITMLALIGATALRGLGKVDEGFNRMTTLALGLIAATLLFAALGVQATPLGLTLVVTGRSVAVAALLASLVPLARRFDAWDLQQWLWETWRFVRMIFPLLIAGVFLVGVIRLFIRPEWIQAIAGANTVAANLAGVVFGVFMYFPTLVEVPIAKMFLSLGMHPGPLIAYLMADPELSLQSILITTVIIGKLKAWTYVGLVALFSTASGLAYGAWIDGAPIAAIALAIAAFVFSVVAALHFADKHGSPASA